MIAKDLIKGDSAIAELKLANLEISHYEEKLATKDSIITKLEETNKNSQDIVKDKDLKYQILENHNKDLEKMIRKYKTKSVFSKLFSVVMIGTLTYVLILK